MNPPNPRVSSVLEPPRSSQVMPGAEQGETPLLASALSSFEAANSPEMAETFMTPKAERIPAALLLSLSLLTTGCATPAHSGGGVISTAASWPSSATETSGTPNSSCSLLETAPTEDVRREPLPAGTRLMKVGSAGACFTGNVGAPILMAVPANQPRLLGYARITLLHPGDSVILDEGATPAHWQPASASQVAEAMNALNSVDARFGSLKPPIPAKTHPLTDLSTLSSGIVSALGSFGFEDNRPADGLSVAQVVIQGSKVGDTRLTVAQSYKREGGRSDIPPSGVREQALQLTVLPKTQALTWSLRELELSPPVESEGPRTLSLGEGDLSVWTVTLGLMSRMGSETRGTVGITAQN